VLLATKVMAPADRGTRDEAIGLLRERVCAGGGWNYGNPAHLDADLPAYAQTTAVALIALQREDPALIDPGMRFLRRNWRLEPGGLTVAQSLLAFRLHGVSAEIPAAMAALDVFSNRASFVRSPLAVAWSVLATAPGATLDALRPRT
jgi:hypothetical protein